MLFSRVFSAGTYDSSRIVGHVPNDNSRHHTGRSGTNPVCGRMAHEPAEPVVPVARLVVGDRGDRTLHVQSVRAEGPVPPTLEHQALLAVDVGGGIEDLVAVPRLGADESRCRLLRCGRGEGRPSCGLSWTDVRYRVRRVCDAARRSVARLALGDAGKLHRRPVGKPRDERQAAAQKGLCRLRRRDVSTDAVPDARPRPQSRGGRRPQSHGGS